MGTNQRTGKKERSYNGNWKVKEHKTPWWNGEETQGKGKIRSFDYCWSNQRKRAHSTKAIRTKR